MKLKKICLENIRSYEKQEIEFKGHSTLLSGDIGSGKSSILLGIEFALFGLQPGQRGSFLLRNMANDGGVTLKFEIDGKDIVIKRTLKRGKTISQNYCSIRINGNEEECSVTELKNKVLELLNYPKEFSKKQNILYKFTVYTPQEEMKQIISQDPEIRINTIRHVFGIDKYKKILDNISLVVTKIREEKRIKEGETTNLEQDKKQIFLKENDLELMKESLASLGKKLLEKIKIRKKKKEEKEEVSKKKEEKIKLQQEVEKTKILCANKKESLSENNRLIKQLNIQIEEFKKSKFDELKFKEIEENILKKRKEKEKLNSVYSMISGEISALLAKNENDKKIESKMCNLEICPTCLQDVDSVYRANVLNKIHNDLAKNKRKIEELEIEKQEKFKQIKDIEEDLLLKERELTNLKILKMKLKGIKGKELELNEVIKSNKILEKDIELLDKHLINLNDSIFNLGKYDTLYIEKQKELEEAFKQEKIAEIKVAELKREIEVFSRHINELKEKIKFTEEAKKKLDSLIELEGWILKKFIPVISSIEKNVMIKLKAEFLKLFEQWFCMLVSDSFTIQLKDDFTPLIGIQDYDIDYAYLSGGEKTAVALAYRLSLNQVINSVLSNIKTKDLVILDEPTDGFSEQQLDKMRGVLEQLNIKQLIIVSHEQKIEGFVENVIRFKKENGISAKE
jgi:exonuclease SbcC